MYWVICTGNLKSRQVKYLECTEQAVRGLETDPGLKAILFEFMELLARLESGKMSPNLHQALSRALCVFENYVSGL